MWCAHGDVMGDRRGRVGCGRSQSGKQGERRGRRGGERRKKTLTAIAPLFIVVVLTTRIAPLPPPRLSPISHRQHLARLPPARISRCLVGGVRPDVHRAVVRGRVRLVRRASGLLRRRGIRRPVGQRGTGSEPAEEASTRVAGAQAILRVRSVDARRRGIAMESRLSLRGGGLDVERVGDVVAELGAECLGEGDAGEFGCRRVVRGAAFEHGGGLALGWHAFAPVRARR